MKLAPKVLLYLQPVHTLFLDIFISWSYRVLHYIYDLTCVLCMVMFMYAGIRGNVDACGGGVS